jgi:hypothetical protein
VDSAKEGQFRRFILTSQKTSASDAPMVGATLTLLGRVRQLDGCGSAKEGQFRRFILTRGATQWQVDKPEAANGRTIIASAEQVAPARWGLTGRCVRRGTGQPLCVIQTRHTEVECIGALSSSTPLLAVGTS